MALSARGWNSRVRAGLEGLIAEGSGKQLPAVFDFDNTIICGDIGEAALAMLASDGSIQKDKIPESLAPSFTSSEGKRIALAECRDMTEYYEELLSATRHQHNDFAPLASGYVWAVEVMCSLSPREVVQATSKVYAQSEPFVLKTIEATPGGNSYPVPFFYSEMVELIAELIKNRFEVWIVSASNVWSVRWMVLYALNPALMALGCGEGILPERVIGVSTLVADTEGKLYKDPLLVRTEGQYARMEDGYLSQLRLTGRINYPAPTYSGKVAAILDLIGRKPAFAAGDSPGDLPMLAWSHHRLWISRLDKPAYRREMEQCAARGEGGMWLVQPVSGKDAAGFVGE